MTCQLKRAVLSSIIMLFISAFFILGLEIYQRPDGEGLANSLSKLEEYEGGEYISVPPSVYLELNSLDAEQLFVYKVPDTAKEFAVASFDDYPPEAVTGVYQARLAELAEEFDQNPQELARIDAARIITINGYAILVVADTEGEAASTVFKYFELQ